MLSDKQDDSQQNSNDANLMSPNVGINTSVNVIVEHVILKNQISKDTKDAIKQVEHGNAIPLSHIVDL